MDEGVDGKVERGMILAVDAIATSWNEALRSSLWLRRAVDGDA